MRRDVILTEVQSLTKTRVGSDQLHRVHLAAESSSPEERTAPRVVLFRSTSPTALRALSPHRCPPRSLTRFMSSTSTSISVTGWSPR